MVWMIISVVVYFAGLCLFFYLCLDGQISPGDGQLPFLQVEVNYAYVGFSEFQWLNAFYFIILEYHNTQFLSAA